MVSPLTHVSGTIMKKILIILGVLMLTSTSVYAVEACGPEFSTGVGIGDSNSSSSDGYTDMQYHGYDRGNSNELSLNFELTWQLGWKNTCERANAIEEKESRANAEAATIETLTDKIAFCLETETKYKELGRDLPVSVVGICRGLL